MAAQDHADERAPLGRALREAREERGLQVADVASAINLRETVVRAMERDDFSLCGGHVYARGHLRAFARQVGLDPIPLLAAYAEQHGSTSGPSTVIRPRVAAADLDADPPTQPVRRVPAAPAATASCASSAGAAAATAPRSSAGDGPVPPLATRRTRPGRDVPLERGGPNWGLVVGAVLAVLVVLLVVQLVGDLRAPGRGTSEIASPVTSSPTSSATTSPSAPVPTPSGTPTTGSTSAPTTGAGGAVPVGVRLALKATGESWVSVRNAAGRTVFSGLLSKGDARRFADGKGLRLTVGNAGAVQLTVNGKAIGSAGGAGQVVRLKFGPGDPA